MAIEPLSSAMTYQVQPVQPSLQTENSANNNKSVAGNMDGTAQDEAAQSVDSKLVVVESSQDANADGGNGEASGQQGKGEASNEQIKQAVEELNKKMMGHSEALFGIHEDTNRLTIKIVDKNTKETIKEYPPEKTLDMIARIWDMAGILVDEKR